MADQIDAVINSTVNGFNPNPKTWDQYYKDAAAKYNVPEDLLRAISWHESRDQAHLVSSAGAQGNMQIMPANAKRLGINAFSPAEAIPAAALMLRQAYDQPLKTGGAGGIWNEALRIYAGGPNREIWGNKTQSYPTEVRGILDNRGVDSVKVLGPSDIGTTTARMPVIEGGVTAPAPASAPSLNAPSTTVSKDTIDDVLNGVLTPALQQPQQPQPSAPAANTAAPAPTMKPLEANTDFGLDDARAKANAIIQRTADANRLWGPGSEVMSGAVLGFGPEIKAATQAMFGNSGLPYSEAYRQALSQYGNAQEEWGREHPMASVGLSALGSLPSTMGGIGAIKTAVGVPLRIAARALPYSSDAIGAAGRFLGGQGGGGLIPRMVSGGVGGAGEGAIAGGLQSHMSTDPIQRQITTGAEVGSVLGPVGRLIGAGIGPMVNPSIRPELGQLSQNYEQLLRNAGQNPNHGLRPDQLTTNPMLKYMGRGIDATKQLEAFSPALANTIGSNAETITRQEFAAARDKIGRGLDSMANRTGIANDADLTNDIQAIARDVNSKLYLPSENAIRSQIDRALTTIQMQQLMTNGNLPGHVYQDMTKTGSFVADLINNSDPTLRKYGLRIRETLDDALERGSRPEDVSKLRELRTQWKNTVVLQELVKRQGASGVLSPPQLAAQARKVYGDFGWNPPKDISTLADVGQLLPNADVAGMAKVSGPSRLARTVEHLLPYAAGAAVAAHGESAIGGALLGGAAAVHGVRKAIHSALESEWLRKHGVSLGMGQSEPINNMADFLSTSVFRAPNQRFPGMAVPLVTQFENANKGEPR